MSLRVFALGFILGTVMVVSAHAENRVGVVLPMTGDFARYGERVREGLESERAQTVRYVYEDEGCNPTSLSQRPRAKYAVSFAANVE